MQTLMNIRIVRVVFAIVAAIVVFISSHPVAASELKVGCESENIIVALEASNGNSVAVEELESALNFDKEIARQESQFKVVVMSVKDRRLNLANTENDPLKIQLIKKQ